MCHDIEDPTFDATAVATNPKAQVRPIHRPPRVPADRQPHCRWTVVIDESHPSVTGIPALDVVRQTRAATAELDPIDSADEGESNYSGPLLSDLDFGAFSHSALTRIADEVCLQMHLLNLGFGIAVRARANSEQQACDIRTKQLIGIAGVGAQRIHRALGLPKTGEAALRVLQLHPLLNPAAYVDAGVSSAAVHVHSSAAHADGAWISMCTPGERRPVQAIVAAVDPHLDVEITGTDTDWIAHVVHRDTPAKEFPEVAVAKISRGATFEFAPRRSLPLTVV
jgi:hypothetical protein